MKNIPFLERDFIPRELKDISMGCEVQYCTNKKGIIPSCEGHWTVFVERSPSLGLMQQISEYNREHLFGSSIAIADRFTTKIYVG